MIDLHTHTIFSDGVLIPSELARRYEAAGYSVVAITDHIDKSNYDFIVPRIVSVCSELNRQMKIRVIPGAEITHVPPDAISPLVAEVRKMGAEIVIVHGETIVEPVAPGTNRAAILSGIDILAHPGLLSHEDAVLAAEKGVYIEISGRRGHSFGNGHIVSISREISTRLVLNSDFHQPGDLLGMEYSEKILSGAGLLHEEAIETIKNSEKLVRSKKNGYL